MVLGCVPSILCLVHFCLIPVLSLVIAIYILTSWFPLFLSHPSLCSSVWPAPLSCLWPYVFLDWALFLVLWLVCVSDPCLCVSCFTLIFLVLSVLYLLYFLVLSCLIILSCVSTCSRSSLSCVCSLLHHYQWSLCTVSLCRCCCLFFFFFVFSSGTPTDP